MLKRPKILMTKPKQFIARSDFGYHACPLHGARYFQAAQISRSLQIGPSRHVLERMVVAGCMFHQPPVQVVVTVDGAEQPVDQQL